MFYLKLPANTLHYLFNKWLAQAFFTIMEQYIKMKIQCLILIDKKFYPEKLNLIPSTIVIKFLQKRLFEFTRSISRINNTLLHKLREEE